MPDLFVTRDAARNLFLTAVRSVCPETFDDLEVLVPEIQKHFPPNPENRAYYYRLIRRVVYPDSAIGQGSGPEVDLNALSKELHAIIAPWQHRWNLDGEAERRWVSQRLLSTLHGWAVKPGLHLKLRTLIGLGREEVPPLLFPEISIRPEFRETWREFRVRAEKALSDALREYRVFLGERGRFKRKIEPPAIWLAKYQVVGLSWREVADSQNPEAGDPDPKDYNEIRKEGSKLAAFLPLTLRK